MHTLCAYIVCIHATSSCFPTQNPPPIAVKGTPDLLVIMSTAWDGTADGYLHVGRVGLEVSLFSACHSKGVHCVLQLGICKGNVMVPSLIAFCRAHFSVSSVQ